MTDIPATDAPTPQDEDEEENIDGDDEEAPTPSRSLRRQTDTTTPRRTRGRGRVRTRASTRRSQGPPEPEVSEEENNASDTPAPRRRGGFRGHRGGRWARKSGATRAVTAPVDEEGNVLSVLNDEIELPDDEEGETKINKNGELQGGREYRVRTFTLLGRGKRLYMLSTEPARCIGFRDSYLFFQKHKHLYKVLIDEEEKKDLIERELIPHSYKGRSIGVVTARSVFREFGAKIVIGGKKVVDDYDVAGARERGDVEGEPANPDDRYGSVGDYNRNQYVAWHGASAVYHLPPSANAPVPGTGLKSELQGKRKRTAVTGENWMLEHAREASRFNSYLRLGRDEVMDGVYDIHTNVMQYPGITQPTHARWEEVREDENVDDLSLRLSKLDPVYARNYRIHDLCLESAPDSNMPEPGLGYQNPGLAGIPQHILNELPAECRTAFDEAAQKEFEWRSKWLNESTDGHRAHLISSFEWYPK